MSAGDHLSPDEFTARFLPSEYGNDWDEVEDDRVFQTGEGWTVDELESSISKEGVREPVTVYKGMLLEGHHRVIGARRAGKPVPFVEVDSPF